MANINELIDEIEDIMDNASSVPFSRKVSVDPDEIFEIVRDMRDSLPTEIIIPIHWPIVYEIMRKFLSIGTIIGKK